jgi:hypothetical protein
MQTACRGAQLGAPGAGGKSSPFQQRDTNQDGKLTREALQSRVTDPTYEATLFDRLDADKDGSP